MAGGVVLGIRLRFNNHAPQQLATFLAFHQQAADQLGGNLLGGAGEEGLGEGLEESAGDGSGSGRCSVLRLEQTKMRGSGKPKLSDSRFSSAKPAASLKAQVAKRPANQAADEFEAHTPIKPGNLQEAEAICNTLMTTETKDRAISLNLASIDLRK